MSSPKTVAAARRGYHHGNLREALIEAATAMLEEAGSEAISLRAVAARVGVSQTAPYRHFAGKTALLSAVAIPGFRAFGRALAEATVSSDDPKEQLAAMGRAYIDFAARQTGMFRLMFMSDLLSSSRDEELGAVAGGTFGQLAEAVAAVRGETSSRPKDAGAVAAWALFHGLAILCLNGLVHPDMAGGMDHERIVDQAVRSLFSDLLSRPA